MTETCAQGALGTEGLVEEDFNDADDNVFSPPSEEEVNKPPTSALDDADNMTGISVIVTDENQSAITENGEVKKIMKKSVSFPDDQSLIKGYLDPPDPWKTEPSWTTAELIQSYKKGCEKHGSKPLSKVVQQLQGIENVSERYEILSLKGEKLDIRQCEGLEEIFRRVRFRCIDLESSHLDDEICVSLFDMVEYYESACKINISSNKNIGPRGWQSCARLVRKTPSLTVLDAKNCDLNERVIPIIGRSLRMGCFLTKLHVQNSNIAGRALVILVAALKMNETLKELFLGDNKLMPTDGIQVGSLLKFNVKLELLDLRDNHLQDVGTAHVFDGICEQNVGEGLQTLVLWNNQITFQAMTSVNKALYIAEKLETLNFGHNPLTNEGIHVLKDGLLKNKSLIRLGLAGTKITCEGAVALAEVIADNPNLQRVDLQENDIKTAGLMALSLALKVNENLTRLDFDRETKKESGVKDYAEQQKRLQQDINEYLDRNRKLFYKKAQVKKQLEESKEENIEKQESPDLQNNNEINEVEASLYIPAIDSVRRPAVLFSPDLSGADFSPEYMLDSPVVESVMPDSGPNFNLLNPMVDARDSLHSCIPKTPEKTSPISPPVPELLSPQYIPTVKAKKLFSVTRVESSQYLPVTTSVSSAGLNTFITHPGLASSSIFTPGPDMLSPQCIPKAKPKKLFSVTKVETTHSPVNRFSSIPIPHPSSLDIVSVTEPSVHLPTLVSQVVSPLCMDTTSSHIVNNFASPDYTEASEIKEKLAAETIEMYTREIIDTAEGNVSQPAGIQNQFSGEESFSGSQTSLKSGNKIFGKVVHSESDIQCGDNDSVVNKITEVSHEPRASINLQVSDSDLSSENSLARHEISHNTNREDSSHKLCSDNDSVISGSDCTFIQETFKGTLEGVERVTIVDDEKVKGNDVCVVESSRGSGDEWLTAELDKAKICHDVDKTFEMETEMEKSSGNIPNADILQDLEDEIACKAVSNNNKVIYGDIPISSDSHSQETCQSLNELSPLDELVEDYSSGTSGNPDALANADNSDLDQWNTIDTTDLLVGVGCGTDGEGGGAHLGKDKPDFFTSLTMNGLKQELANLIDDVDVDGGASVNSASNLTSPAADGDDICETAEGGDIQVSSASSG